MAKKIWIPVAAGAAALGLVATVAITTVLHKNDVVLTVDGAKQQLSVRERTVGEVLAGAGIKLGQHDVVLPSADSKVNNGMEINVSYGRPLQLTVDGKAKTVWTTARTVQEALGFLNLDAPDSKYSSSRSTGIGREGLKLEVATAKNVTLTVAGKPSKLTIAGTVSDVLQKAGVKPDRDDKLTPAATTVLTEGMAIKFVKVDIKTSTKDVAFPFKTSDVKSDELEKGKTKVSTKGVDGLWRDTYRDVYEDGKLVSSTKTGRVVAKQPVNEVVTVGTKPKPAPVSNNDSTSTPPATTTPDNSSQNLTPAAGNSCKASYYWKPQNTASGEWFNPNAMTAAHKTMRLGSRVKVTNPANGKTVVVRINDRGPYIAGRCLDLSRAAMQKIGGTSAGVIRVNYQVIG